jgi:hypothetical protein
VSIALWVALGVIVILVVLVAVAIWAYPSDGSF